VALVVLVAAVCEKGPQLFEGRGQVVGTCTRAYDPGLAILRQKFARSRQGWVTNPPWHPHRPTNNEEWPQPMTGVSLQRGAKVSAPIRSAG
jgi:hypothetical protein